MNAKVDAYLKRAKAWKREMTLLRAMVLDCGLEEELKWGKPCYTIDGNNVVIIQAFKDYVALMFFKGALLKDAKGILVQPGQVQAGRQIRFAGLAELSKLEKTVKTYIREAIKIERAGLEVEYKTQFTIPEELLQKFREKPALKKAFDALTPGRQRGYVYYFSAAKQTTTRTSRIEKCAPAILKGKGLND